MEAEAAPSVKDDVEQKEQQAEEEEVAAAPQVPVRRPRKPVLLLLAERRVLRPSFDCIFTYLTYRQVWKMQCVCRDLQLEGYLIVDKKNTLALVPKARRLPVPVFSLSPLSRAEKEKKSNYGVDLADVEALCEAHFGNADVLNQKNEQGETRAHCVIRKGNAAALDLLIRAGSSVNLTNNKTKDSLVTTAVRQNKPHCLELLLRTGVCDLMHKNVDDETASIIAIKRGHERCAALIASAGVDVQAARKMALKASVITNRIRKSGAAGGGGYREDDDVDDPWDMADVKAADPSLRFESYNGKSSSSSSSNKGSSLHVERPEKKGGSSI